MIAVISKLKTTVGSDYELAKKLRGACESVLVVKSSSPVVVSNEVSQSKFEHRSTGKSKGLSTETYEQV